MTRTTLSIVTVLAALALAPAAAGGTSLISMTDASGDPAAVRVAPGDAFVVNVSLTADVPFNGLTFFLTASESDRFTITGRAAAGGNPLEDATSDDIAVAAAPLAPSSVDLGYGNVPLTANVAPGTYAIASYTLSSAAGIPAGTYELRATGGVLSDAAFGESAVPASAPYIVTVAVPEPAATAAAAGAAALPLARRPRRGRR